jgi:hypothetical protein
MVIISINSLSPLREKNHRGLFSGRSIFHDRVLPSNIENPPLPPFAKGGMGRFEVYLKKE